VRKKEERGFDQSFIGSIFEAMPTTLNKKKKGLDFSRIKRRKE
jgi:hypothetical protein